MDCVNGIHGSSSPTHVVLFPFMSKGHTIPILHLARLLLRRGGVAVTVITTPANRPFIANFLVNTQASIYTIPFAFDIAGIPSGVESTDKLPSMSLFYQFAVATKSMQSQFEKFLSSSLSHISFIVSDGFLPWTLDSSSKFGIPRFVCYGMSSFAMTIIQEIHHNLSQIHHDLTRYSGADEIIFSVPNLPSVKVAVNDFEKNVLDPDRKGDQADFASEMVSATSRSHGVIVNSFYELEPVYFDHWNRHHGPKAWDLGPFFLGEPLKENGLKSPWMDWLDMKLENGESVLYIAFGSQAELSREVFEEIQIGLEKSEVNFLWVVRGFEDKKGDGFENRVKNRGMVVREWVEQREILEHKSVTGFLSHCGWNSVIESICAKVPILAWPMMAEQHLNARFITDEIGVGIRVETCDGSVRGVVKWKGLEKMVRELMEGEKGKEVRKKVEEVGVAAMKAVADGGGSSWQALNDLIIGTSPKAYS
ncbi:UDP-glycosyltransferase 90A1-like [Impatiens glandulifera]|uniref:UDP-glycosyltransferase 90A1-like n=1 Tax=Impatiens glandulifera TaxID=253017 RepID=UPI001FB16F6F|nr:UDP-glycosyltransferase 90A1-like [Impatiens glandulifera]